MSEYVLAGVVVALCVYLGWKERENRREKEKLINALLAKNAQELRDLEFVEKVKIPEVNPQPEPFVSTEDMTQEEFDKHIEEVNKE